MTVLELPFDARTRETLANKMVGSKRIEEHVTAILVQRAAENGDWRTALFLYDQMRARNSYCDRNVVRRAKRAFYRLLVRFPHCGRRLIGHIRGHAYLEGKSETDGYMNL
jgi:pentatricopeptide repeat protein